jgi:hypothetical protein
MMATILEMGCGEVSIGQNTDAASTLDTKTMGGNGMPTYLYHLPKALEMITFYARHRCSSGGFEAKIREICV